MVVSKSYFSSSLIKHYVMKIHGVEVYIHEFLSSTLVGDDNFILLPKVYEDDFAPDSVCTF